MTEMRCIVVLQGIVGTYAESSLAAYDDVLGKYLHFPHSANCMHIIKWVLETYSGLRCGIVLVEGPLYHDVGMV